jgi:hypothetical protein
MVGDIIQDPLGGLVKGAVVAGSWAIGSAINAYKQNYDFVSDYGRDFLNGKFTTDDLVDVPPPPAEDIGTVDPDAPPSEGGQSSSGSSGKTFEELATELVQNEAKYGIQSPLGPEDPNFVSFPVQQQERNKDPQAPLKPGFTSSPSPVVPSTPGANLILRFRHPGGPYPESPTPEISFYPKLRGQTGAKKNLSKNGFDVFAVPQLVDGAIRWKARFQMKRNEITVGTWELDAGTRPPSSGEVTMFTSHTTYGDGDLLDYPPEAGILVSTYPLQVSAAPPVIPDSSTNQLVSKTGKDPLLASFSPSQPSWTSALMDPPAESDNLPGEGLLPLIPIPAFPPTPVFPSTAVPINPNNPVANPAIGTNGLPLQNISQIVSTGTDVHKIGELTVNSGKIRATTASIAKEVGRIEQKTANTANAINPLLSLIPDLLFALSLLKPPPKAPGAILTMNAFCDENEEGQPESYSVSYPEMEMLEGILDRINDIPGFLEQHLAWKTPTCGNEKPELLGEWVTTRWESDEKMVDSGRRLRKLFRYRTQSSRDLGQLSDYWATFTWRAGPVCVRHEKAWWGNPQVWAESAEEGKRVIRHAAAEAGLNPDQVGRWAVSSSRSPRYGMSGTMKILKKEGFPWVASRQGPNWPNYLAL